MPAAAKRVFAIAWPAIAESYFQNLLGFIDMVFIAHIGLTAVSAVGVTNIYNLTYNGVFLAVAASLSVFLSRAVGAGDPCRGRSALWHGYSIAVCVGLILSLVSIFGALPMLHIMGAGRVLARTALPYFRVVLGSAPLMALFTSQSAAFRAIGDTKTPLLVSIEMNIVHVVLDYVLIFGLGPIPGFGLRGAAWSMVIVRVYALFRLWGKARSVQTIRLNKADCRFDGGSFRQMLKFAAPVAGERLSMRLGQVIYFGLIVRMGVEVYATHNIAGTFTAFSSTIGGGFAAATTAAMGQAVGSGDHQAAAAYRRWSYILAAIAMTVVTAILCLLSPWVGMLFTPNIQVLHLLFVVLAIDTLSQPFLAAVNIDTVAIQVGGNSRYPMLVTTVGIWGVRTLGIYLLAWRIGWGLPAVWGCIAADNAIRSVLFARYRKQKTLIRRLWY